MVNCLAVFSEKVLVDRTVVEVDLFYGRADLTNPNTRIAIEYYQPGYETVIVFGDKKYWIAKKLYLKDEKDVSRARLLYLQEADFSPETHQWIDSSIAKAMTR